MFCPQCGTTNSDDSRFCTKCGLDLDAYKAGWSQGGASSGSTGGGYQAPPPPPYQQPQYQQPYQAYQQPQPQYGPGHGLVPRVPSYLGWAIAVLILCFWPTGIVAVVHASRVGNRLAIGDINGAMESSRKAKTWCWITFIIAIVWIAFLIIAAVAGLFATNWFYYN